MVVKRLAASLDPKRFRSVVCLYRPGWLYDINRDQGIPTSIMGINGALDVRWARQFAALLKKEHVSVIHAHEFTANTYGSLIGRIMRVPVVATVHGKNYFADQLKRRIAYRFVSRASRMVAVSEDLKRFIVDRVGVADNRISVVYNGVDVPPRPSVEKVRALRLELGVEQFEHVIGAVGSLYPVKGHTHLIQALPRILQACPRTVLLLAGRGELEGELKAEVRRLGLDAYVRFLGFRSDVPVLLSLFDLFVLPSLSEGLSMALLEAMAAGNPVVATEVGGNAELVVDGDTGYLIPPESPAALADAVIRVLSDKVRSTGMGDRGRQRVHDKFSFQAMIDAYQAHYECAIGRSFVNG
jgi:glycosyltransferase involved in cell wall biosynthesis